MNSDICERNSMVVKSLNVGLYHSTSAYTKKLADHAVCSCEKNPGTNKILGLKTTKICLSY